MRVYMLSVYDEYGAEEMIGATDPSRLEAMLLDMGKRLWNDPIMAVELETLRSIQPLKPGKYNLSKGWGGAQLHVVDLES